MLARRAEAASKSAEEARDAALAATSDALITAVEERRFSWGLRETAPNWHIGEVPTSWFESAIPAHSPRKPRGNLRVLMTSIAAAAGLIATGLTASAVAGIGAGLAQLRVRKAADNG